MTDERERRTGRATLANRVAPWLAGFLWFVCGVLATLVVTRERRAPTNVPAVTVAPPAPLEATKGKPSRPENSAAQLRGALEMLDPTARAEALRRLARELAADPAAGQAMAAQIVNFDDRLEFLRAFVQAWAARDPQAALAYARSQPSGLLHDDSVAAACGGWAVLDPQAAAGWARQSVSGPVLTKSLAEIARTWAGVEPAAAAAWAVTLPPGVISEAALRNAVGTWVNLDPAAAAQWAEGLPDGQRRDSALLQLAHDWAVQCPTECAAWVAKRAASHDDAESLAESLAAEWTQFDAPAASAWIATLPAGDVQNSAAQRAAVAWVTADPAAATAWVAGLENNDLKHQLAPGLAGTWASIDPTAALTWAQGQSEEGLRREVTAEVFDAWAHVDGATLEAWLTDQPAGAAADLAWQKLAEARFGDDPAAALAAAARIADGDERRGRVESLFTFWMEKHADAARDWLRQADVPEALRPALEEQVARAIK